MTGEGLTEAVNHTGVADWEPEVTASVEVSEPERGEELTMFAGRKMTELAAWDAATAASYEGAGT